MPQTAHIQRSRCTTMGHLIFLVFAVFAFITEARLGTGGAAMATETNRGPDTVMATASLDGDPCPSDEMNRYYQLVCRTEAACGCADTRCELDWCSEYVHKWKEGICCLLLEGLWARTTNSLTGGFHSWCTEHLVA